ncbi:MAG: tRNA pseudouridine synthase A [Nitrospirae bacterium]|nr:tRNA pseudouridine synthase A [Nitrospirota bacterium]
MKNIRLLIEYDGTNYHGWQKQRSVISHRLSAVNSKNIITIQGILQETIKKIVGEDIKLISASRTDAGVHALGQVASFKTNSYLKTYLYLISNMNISSAFLYRYTWRVPYKLNLDIMRETSGLLRSSHDFSAFRGTGCGAKNTEREIILLDVEMLNKIDFMTVRLDGNFIKIRITANAFLRHMVRNIVGTLVETGRGKMTLRSVLEAIELKDRKKTGPTAPANGLFLETIRY